MNKTFPIEWKLVKLEDVSSEIYRYPSYYNIEYVDMGIKEIRGELIKDNGELERNPSMYRKISKVTSNRFPKTILKEGDFVLSVRGTIGKIAIIRKSEDGSNITANLMRISLDKKRCNPDFYKYILLSRNFQKKLNLVSSFTTIKTIQANRLKSLKIPLPPLPEQKKIAEILSTVDLAIAKVDIEIKKVGRIKKGFIRKLFDSRLNPLDLKNIPKDWKVIKAEKVCLKVTDGTHDTPKKVNKGYSLITSKNIKNGRIVFDDTYFIDDKDYKKINERSKVDTYDLLFSMIGTIGQTAIVRASYPKFAIKNVGLFKTSRNESLAFWLHYYFYSKLASTFIKDSLKGSTQKYIPLFSLRDFPIIVPPKKYRLFVIYVFKTIDRKLGLLRGKKEKLEKIKKGLMNDLLTGRKRVRMES